MDEVEIRGGTRRAHTFFAVNGRNRPACLVGDIADEYFTLAPVTHTPGPMRFFEFAAAGYQWGGRR